MMNRTIAIVFLLLAIFSLPVCAQKEQTRWGEYTYVYEDYISEKQAKQIALERAREQAINDAFGTVTSTDGSVSVSTISGVAQLKYFKVSDSELLGEWRGDVGAPEYKFHERDETGRRSVSCRVKVRIRERNRAKVQFDWHLWRTHEREQAEARDGVFRHEDKIFMTFRSPIDGYMVVYLVDEMHNANLLIPHTEQPEGCYRIEQDQDYVFFKSKHDNNDTMIPPNELIVFTEGMEEYNQVYVFFSPNKFARGNWYSKGANADIVDERGRPRELLPQMSENDFRKWMHDLRTDKDMQMEKKIIVIRKHHD